MIPYGRQDITQADIDAVTEVLRSDWITQGPAIPRFEKRVAAYCGVEHAVAFNSATSALHGACAALGVGPGDAVWTVPNTFVASANCARYCGARVDFVDIDPVTYNLSVERLSEKLIEAKTAGSLPKVVIPVHFSGRPCDMRAIHALSKEYGFSIIEDASHAIGARYLGEPVGNGQYSDITIFSFHPVKIITTGEGGMATTRNLALANRLARFRTHGITRAASEMVGESEGPWYYQQVELGFNYRLTDVQAVLGLSQMDRLDAYVARRVALSDRYNRLLEDAPVRLPQRSADGQSAWHLYVVRLDPELTVTPRREAFETMRALGIGVNVHYIPVHLQPYYRELGFRPGMFPESEKYYTETLSLPLYATLSEEQQDQVVAALHQAVKRR